MRPGASPEACRAAYRRLVRVHHPDAHPDATGAERAVHAAALRQVVVAYESLAGPGQAVGPADGGRAEGWLAGAVDDELLERRDASLDDELDDLGPAADVPLSSAGAGRAPAVIAMGLVAASFVSFCVSVVMSQTALWQLSLGLGFAALLAFILLPFFVMLRSHR